MNETKRTSAHKTWKRPSAHAAAILAIAICGVAGAQVYNPNPNSPPYVESPDYSPAPPVTYPSPAYRLEADQLDQLTEPIALYPDPLIAEILPASTYPTEVLAAAQWIRTNGTPAQNVIDAQPWEASVRALVHYPTVLQMMADRSDWMEQLGNAFVNQPDDVMDSIQRLRGEAQQSGALVTTPQQEVVTEDNEICIRPVADNVIYVPEYDPAVIFVHGHHFDRNAIRFGVGVPIGVWLNYDFNWRQHYVREDVHWDHWHEWHRDHHDDQHHEPVHVEHPPHRWVRNSEKPVVVVPHRPAPDHRGFEPHPAPAPAHDLHDYKPRKQAEREEQRGRESLHPAPPQPQPHPAPRPAPKPAPKLEPRPEPRPAPHPEPHPQPQPQPHPQDNGHGNGGHK